MSSGATITWLSLLEDKQKELGLLARQGYPVPNGPFERQALRRGLVQCCKKPKENPLPLCYKFFEAERFIIQLASGVAKSAPSLQNRQGKEDLESIVRRVAFATLEQGHRNGVSIPRLVNILVDLHKTVPPLGVNVSRFPEDDQVQRPLQDIYGQFLEALVDVLKTVRETTVETSDSVLKDEPEKPMGALVTRLKLSIDTLRADFENLIRQAADNDDLQKGSEHTTRKSQSGGNKIDPKVHETFEMKYKVIRKRGRGSYGVVEEVEEQSTSNRYIRKRILLDRPRGPSREEMIQKVLEEVKNMRNLRHQNIVTLASFFKESIHEWSLLIHPVAEYDLQEFFEKCSEEHYHEDLTSQINPWFENLLDALAFTHKNKIRHRDIKPKNILVKEKAIYLCDFGLARDFSGQESSASHGPILEGTPEYRAPEIHSDQRRGPLADVFSLGCVFSELLGVKHGKSAAEYRTSRGKDFRECLPKVHSWVASVRNLENQHSHILCDIIIWMIQEDPSKRIKSEKALDHIRRERRVYEDMTKSSHDLD